MKSGGLASARLVSTSQFKAGRDETHLDGPTSVMAIFRQLSDAQADPSAILPETVRVHVSPHCGNRLITGRVEGILPSLPHQTNRDVGWTNRHGRQRQGGHIDFQSCSVDYIFNGD